MDLSTEESGSKMDIRSEISCPRCSIALEDVVVLEGAYYNGPAHAIQRSPDGWVYFVDGGDGLVTAYRSDGRFHSKIGSRGGAGEYEFVRDILVAADGSIYILDGTLARLSRFSRDGEFLGSVRVPVIGGVGLPALLMPDGRVLVNDRPRANATSNQVLKLVRGNDDGVQLVGEPVSIAQKPWLVERSLWMRSNGEILVAHPFRFMIDVYNADLTKTATMTRVADWLSSGNADLPPSYGLYDKPFTPQLRSIWEDERRLVWLVMWVPSPDWKPSRSREALEPLSDETRASLSGRPRAETIIEVLDLPRRQVLARARFPGSIGTPLGGGYFATDIEDSAGNPSIRITRALLKQ